MCEMCYPLFLYDMMKQYFDEESRMPKQVVQELWRGLRKYVHKVCISECGDRNGG